MTGWSNESKARIAIERRRPVTFLYRDREGTSSYRVVSPYEIRHPGFASLVAWDHGREAMRHFRIERIEGRARFTDAVNYRPEEG